MRFRLWLMGTLVVIAALTLGVRAALAQDDEPDEPPDQQCITCHSSLDQVVTFEDGEELSILVDVDAFHASIHGDDNPEGALNCTSCHGDYAFPHESTYASARDFRLKWNQSCETCHSQESDLANDSVHAAAMTAGNANAAVCVDCHGSHEVKDPSASRADISRTCGTCHTSVFDLYQESVHGAALLEEGNPDVPTCINCHGVHNIQDPTTNLFRVRSPQLCAQCHANEELMDKYGISTHVFETYVADFHGTTVTLFENQSPDVEVNTAVCYDCHGVHDIRSPDDPESRVVKENLVQTCRRCHPDASEDFAAAWTKHYEPSPEQYPLVFFVNQFYRIFIPAVLGFMGLVVLTDIGRRVVNRLRPEETTRNE